jgi:putative glycosyltransferase (TIGR04348 family)
MPISHPHILIATPADAVANNGNWRTAQRWKTLLGNRFRTIVQNADSASRHDFAAADLLIAMHARKSAAVVKAFQGAHPGRPVLLVLTGTDLYRDLAISPAARDTVTAADGLVVLQEDALLHLPASVRAKAHVIHQSAKTLRPAKKIPGRLRCVVVGHLRHEKSPETIFELMRGMDRDSKIHVLHIGHGIDAAIAKRASELSAANPGYRWCGSLSHGLARAAIKRANVLIHPSAMEGGANVIAEALTSGTPVLASHMSGNIGMLGREYRGYFPVGDAPALRRLLHRCSDDPAFLAALNLACQNRAKLFAPHAEQQSLRRLLNHLLSAVSQQAGASACRQPVA